MKSGARIALFALVIVVAVVGFILVKPEDDSKDQATETTTSAAGQTTTATQPEEPPPPPPVPRIRVRDGKPVGGVQDLEFEKGETAEFFVTADLDDHVHVHGYDLMKDTTPGKPVKFEFEAKIDGQFEVELEESGVEIATLRVNP